MKNVRTPLQRDEILELILSLLRELLIEEGHEGIEITAETPLIAGQAVISSLSLASFVSDLETVVAERSGYEELTLVTEAALSRKHSPFRNAAAFADYVHELLES